ncbi:MAG: hypothetical protein AAGA85_25645 [Bacteroidota bacterium]
MAHELASVDKSDVPSSRVDLDQELALALQDEEDAFDRELRFQQTNRDSQINAYAKPGFMADAFAERGFVPKAYAKRSFVPNVYAKSDFAHNADAKWHRAPDANADASVISMNNAGGGQPVGVVQPYLGVNYCIALQGIYPSRN